MRPIRHLGTVLILMVAAVLVEASAPKHGTKMFYDDDPLEREPATRDASEVREWDIDLVADLLTNSFSRPGDPRENVAAMNVNTADEVPDSSWFTNRIYAQPITLEELRRGPNTIDGPAPGRWTVIRPKSSGFAPGFTVRDSKGEVWFITFDPPSTPRAATGAIAVACRLFWALGYNQVESYLATLRPENLDIAETAQTAKVYGSQRRLEPRDIDAVLARAARNDDGSYRVMAGRAVPGRPVGGFRYYDTRPDDPNDVVPHEHRRELRALKVFGAWTNLVDLKAGNTLDTVVNEDGRGIIRHYLQDVGSTFGTGAQGPREWDEGHEYLFEGRPLMRRLLTLGFYIQPWQTVPYEDSPEIGRFEGDTFDPEQWRSRVPSAAVLRARDDDTFWAALRVAAFSDDMIREAVRAGEYADPAAERLLADVLIKRRDKIALAYLPKVNPLVGFAIRNGVLVFENAAVRAGVASPAPGYLAQWFALDNTNGAAMPLGNPIPSAPGQWTVPVPKGGHDYLRVDVSAIDAPYKVWESPVHVYFRRTGDDWKLIGLERLPRR